MGGSVSANHFLLQLSQLPIIGVASLHLFQLFLAGLGLLFEDDTVPVDILHSERVRHQAQFIGDVVSGARQVSMT